MTSTVSKATTPVAPGILDANYIVPVLIVVFIALNVISDPKYVSLRGFLMQKPQKFLVEICGFISVIAVVVSRLLLAPDGILASKESLATDSYMLQLRQHWPMLLHPDSLIVCQELFLGLGGAVLLARGACNSSSGELALVLGLLTIGRGIHAGQWSTTEDFAPEGPLGGVFAAGAAAVAGLFLLMATLKSLWMTKASLADAIRYLVTLGGLLGLCAYVAKDNYITASDSYLHNVLFSMVDVVDLCAMPLLTFSACCLAWDTANLGGALACFALAQAFAFYWYLDFTGVLDDRLSENPFIVHNLKIKQQLMTQVHGCPFVLFTISQTTRAASALVGFGAYVVTRYLEEDDAEFAASKASRQVQILLRTSAPDASSNTELLTV